MNADVSQNLQEQHKISKSMDVYHILVQMEQPENSLFTDDFKMMLLIEARITI